MSNEGFIKFTSDDSSDEDDNLLPRAFDVSPISDEELTGPPMNGVQYLQRTMAEARKCQGVVTKNIENRQLAHGQYPKSPEVKTCKSDLLFSKEWRISAMADFSKLRLKMEKLRKKLENNKLLIELGKCLPEGDYDDQWLRIVSGEGPHALSAKGPSTRLCLALNQVTLWQLFAVFGDWLNDKAVSVPVACCWLYCLLACVDQPMPPHVDYSLRQIARILINYRAQIDSLESEELPHINLIVCIIAHYFRQLDLADP